MTVFWTVPCTNGSYTINIPNMCPYSGLCRALDGSYTINIPHKCPYSQLCPNLCYWIKPCVAVLSSSCNNYCPFLKWGKNFTVWLLSAAAGCAKVSRFFRPLISIPYLSAADEGIKYKLRGRHLFIADHKATAYMYSRPLKNLLSMRHWICY